MNKEKKIKQLLKAGFNTRFKKGHKFLKGGEKGWFKKGIVPKTAWKKGDTAWNKNPQWNPHSTSYSTMHQRLRKIRGCPKKCEMCGLNNQEKHYEWANLTGNYTNFSDYKRMCKPCHIAYDKKRRLYENGYVVGKKTKKKIFIG